MGIAFRSEPAVEHTLRVSGAGDINGDGLADLLIGSPFADPKGPDSGAAYVIFGRPAVQADPRTVMFTEGDGDVVTVNRQGRTRVQVVSSFTMPLDVQGVMTVQGRAQVLRSVEAGGS